MTEQKVPKQVAGKIGRNFALLYNRGAMYNIDHPFTTQAITDLYQSLKEGFSTLATVVFLMDKEQFFIEEEPLDPRINTGKMLLHFKKSGVQSISFEKGLQMEDLEAFTSVFIDLTHYSNADLMKEALKEQGVDNIRINHVFFKKVTADDQVVDKRVLEEAQTGAQGGAGGGSGGSAALNIVAEHVLMAELEKSLSLAHLLQNPTQLSKAMIADDLSAEKGEDTQSAGYGNVILQQLQQISQKVGQAATTEKKETNLQDLAAAVFEMKKDLLKGIEAQKANGVIFVNESQIIEQSNSITDSVLIQLIEDEYKSGKISVKRLGQIIRRLIPDPKELQRLMPKIKSALLDSGMQVSEFLDLTQELRKELQSEELSKVLERSAEEIGVSGQDLIHEINVDPNSAAELIYLASEIRKGTGDDKVLSNLLVDYIERVGSKIAMNSTGQLDEPGDAHLRTVVSEIESKLVKGLQQKDIDTDVISDVELRLNERLDEYTQKVKTDLKKAKPPKDGQTSNEGAASILKLFEESLEDGDEFKSILSKVQQSAGRKGIDVNDLQMLRAEIAKTHQERQTRRQQSDTPAKAAPPATKPKPAAPAKISLPPGVLNRKSTLYFLEKEVFRSIRYGTPFSVIVFSILKVKPQKPVKPDAIRRIQLNSVILEKMAEVFRETDILGYWTTTKSSPHCR